MHRILALNPGATSTKFAVFDDEQPVFQRTIEHQGSELSGFSRICDQADYRLELITTALNAESIPLSSLNAVVGRGGLLKPLIGGTYSVNEAMLVDLRACARGEHASNLGGIIADALAKKLGIPAFIVDPVSVDEMEPEARLSGHPEIPRDSLSHALNSKAVARRAAADVGKNYAELNLVIAHLGSGISVTAHRRGRMIDVNNAQEEGPFSPDRGGGLPSRKLVRLCYSGKYTEAEMLTQLMGNGGMFAYLGTRDLREVEARAAAGNNESELVFKAMAYQIAKETGAMAAALSGQVDYIIITGGMAWSKRLVDELSERVSFIAPILVMAGEEELPALNTGALRVLRDEEAAQTY